MDDGGLPKQVMGGEHYKVNVGRPRTTGLTQDITEIDMFWEEAHEAQTPERLNGWICLHGVLD